VGQNYITDHQNIVGKPLYLSRKNTLKIKSLNLRW